MKQTVGMIMGIYNEAHRIMDCLEWHAPYMDEIMIVIQQSDDGTEGVVDQYIKEHPQYPISVLHFPKKGFSEATLQDGLEKMDSDWILYVDADEKFPKEFLESMQSVIEPKNVDGYWFERDNYFDVPVFNDAVPIEPKTLRIKHPTRDRQFRLTRRSMTYFPRQVHVRARVRGSKMEGTEERTAQLSYTMYHLKSLDEQWNDNTAYLPQTKLVDAMEKTRHGQMIEFQEHQTDGRLIVGEALKEIPFPIERVFWIIGAKEKRGGHANRKVNEVLVAIAGSCKVKLTNERGESEFILNDPKFGLYIRHHTWIEMSDFSDDCILLCLATEHYNREDYIWEFEKLEKELKEIF